MKTLATHHAPLRCLCWLALGWLTCATAAGHQTTEAISVGYASGQTVGGATTSRVSADGRHVSFTGSSPFLVPGDTNGVSDIFVRDRLTGSTERVSLGNGGTEPNGQSNSGSISADGQLVAFQSVATNLGAGNPGNNNVYVRDRQNASTELITYVTPDDDGTSGGPSISANGRYVAYSSTASTLVAGDTNEEQDIFLYDRQTGSTERVNLGPLGAEANGFSNMYWGAPTISGDGRWTVFSSSATNLVSGDTNAQHDVFAHDRLTGTTHLVSVDSGGAQSNGSSQYGSISTDGRWVCFESTATNLVAGDTNGQIDVFVHDLQTGTTVLGSLSSTGEQAEGQHCIYSSISGDGRFVAFESRATNLVPHDVNGQIDVFVRDLQAGTTELVSLDSLGVQANGHSGGAVISSDGSVVAFNSYASNLAPNAPFTGIDIYARDRTCSSEYVSYCTAGTSSAGCAATLSANGTASASASSGFVVTADSIEGQRNGIFFFGQNGRQANPWGSGTSLQCVVPPVRRTAVLFGGGTGGACDGTAALDLNALWCPACPKPALNPVPSQPLQVQFWYRDPLNTSNQTTSLSDALEVMVCPGS